MKAYVLIKVHVGEVELVAKQLNRIEGVLETDITFGPYDVVAIIAADDIKQLGYLVYSAIQPIPGVQETLTCLVVNK